MSDQLEDLFVAECRRQGHQPNDKIMRELAVILAGSTLNGQSLIVMPGKGSLSIRDLANSLRTAMPESFTAVSADQPKAKPPAGATLTECMRLEIEATRRRRPLPEDWRIVRDRYAPDTLTAKMMASREASWK